MLILVIGVTDNDDILQSRRYFLRHRSVTHFTKYPTNYPFAWNGVYIKPFNAKNIIFNATFLSFFRHFSFFLLWFLVLFCLSPLHIVFQCERKQICAQKIKVFDCRRVMKYRIRNGRTFAFYQFFVGPILIVIYCGSFCFQFVFFVFVSPTDALSAVTRLCRNGAVRRWCRLGITSKSSVIISHFFSSQEFYYLIFVPCDN